MSILYINSCACTESRTNKIAKALLEKLGNDYIELNIYDENLEALNEQTLERRSKLISLEDYSDDCFKYAKQFAKADIIVIAAPFWDLSFPAALKIYLENIYVMGIVSKYSSEGIPIGLCKATKLYYVTTAGGPYVGTYSYEYIKDLAINYFGIKETRLIKAEMLDIIGNNAMDIVDSVISVLEV